MAQAWGGGGRQFFPDIQNIFRTYRNFSWNAKIFKGHIVTFRAYRNFSVSSNVGGFGAGFLWWRVVVCGGASLA